MKDKLAFVIDIILARRYTKQIMIANIASLIPILGYYFYRDRRDYKEMQRQIAAAENAE